MALLREVIITVIVFGVIIAGASTIVGDMNDNYGINASTQFDNTYNKIDEMQNQTKDMQAVVTEEGGFLTGTFELLIKGTWYVLKMIIGTLEMIGAMITDIFVDLGFADLPYFGIALFSIITITVITMILSVVMKREI